MISKQFCIRISDESLAARIEKLAKENNWAIADVFREAVKDYLRQDKIKEELNDFEKRMVATLQSMYKELRRLNNQDQAIITFLDLFAKSYFVHTPTVPRDALDVASANAKMRYENLIKQVGREVHSTHGLMNVVVNLESGFDV